jgi:hypothetical protein
MSKRVHDSKGELWWEITLGLSTSVTERRLDPVESPARFEQEMCKGEYSYADL